LNDHREDDRMARKAKDPTPPPGADQDDRSLAKSTKKLLKMAAKAEKKAAKAAARASEGEAAEKSPLESRKERTRRYEKELERLQAELAHLQAWVRATGARVIIVFEGRDAAGKGGVIRRLTERVSPRVFRVVALPAPTDREKTQLYIQRYIHHFPAAGEIVIFDRSWYNRPGVERVMGFTDEETVRHFLEMVPKVEAVLVHQGFILLKYFLTVSEEEQDRRFHRRIDDPLRQWKLSPMDVESYRRWWDYSAAYDEMIRMTDTPHAPWWIVPSDDKKSARINCISHILSSIPYERVPFEAPDLGKRRKRPKGYVEDRSARNVVPSVF
jgi:polyphosphate kinase 2